MIVGVLGESMKQTKKIIDNLKKILLLLKVHPQLEAKLVMD